MIAGRPISSSARSASGSVLICCERGVSRPILVMASRKRLAVLGLVDGVGGGADHLDVELVERALLAQRQRAVQRGLAAHGRQQRKAAGNDVAFLLDDLGDDLRRDRLDVGRVRQFRIGHDRRRIGIDQDDAIALVLQRLHRLRAGIVELAGLADDDGPGADDQDGRDVGSFRHRIKSREAGKWAQKKGALAARPSSPALGINLARGWSLDQIPHPRKGLKGPINRHFWAASRSLFELRRGSAPPSDWPVQPKLRSSEGWRPGLDLNQDKEHCTAPASTLPPPGRSDHRRSRRREPLSSRINPNSAGVKNACRATNVIRHGLWPILECAREAVNPPAASFATISASL